MSTRRLSGSFAFGLLAVALGLLLLLGTFGFLDTGDIFRWIPSLLILLGIWMLVKSRFRQVGGPILIIVVAALIQIMVLGVDLGRFWPLILIAIGVAILISSFRSRGRSNDNATQDPHLDSPNSVSVFGSERKVAPPDQDSINLVSVMGSATQKITSPRIPGRTRHRRHGRGQHRPARVIYSAKARRPRTFSRHGRDKTESAGRLERAS